MGDLPEEINGENIEFPATIFGGTPAEISCKTLVEITEYLSKSRESALGIYVKKNRWENSRKDL